MSTRYVWNIYEAELYDKVSRRGDTFEFTVWGATSSYLGVFGESVSKVTDDVSDFYALYFQLSNTQTLKSGTWYSSDDVRYFMPEVGNSPFRHVSYLQLPSAYKSQPVYFYAYPVSSVSSNGASNMKYTIGAYKSKSTGDPLKSTDLNGTDVFLEWERDVYANTSNTKGYASSASSSTYPNGALYGSDWYKRVGSDSPDPTAISINPSNHTANSSVTISATRSSNINSSYPSIQYVYQVQLNGGSWTTITTTSLTSTTYYIPSGTTSVRFRVQAKDSVGWTGDYVTSSSANTTVSYIVSLSASPNAGGTVSGSGSYTANSSVRVVASPNTGYNFTEWKEGTSSVSSSATHTFNITSNRFLTAYFIKQSYTISVSASPSAGGTVYGGGTVQYGDSVTVKAVANSGYKFSHWLEGNSQVSTSQSYTFTATQSRTLTAVFTQSTTYYTVTVSASPSAGGTVYGGGSYTSGTSLTVVAVANTGYKFTEWVKDGLRVATSNAYNFTVTTNTTLTAQFSSESSGGTGTGSNAFIGIGNIAKKISNIYIGVNNIARKVKKGYIGVDGIARLFYNGGETLAYYGLIYGFSETKTYLAATSVGNYALFGGGFTSNGANDTVDAFDSGLTHTTATELSVSRSELAATTVGNYALFGGGFASGKYRDAVDAYDAFLTKSNPISLSNARAYLAAATVGNFALFGGGNAGDSSYYKTVDVYDTSLTRNTPISLNSSVSNLSATTVGGYALFGGGGYSSSRYSFVNAYSTELTNSTPTNLSQARIDLAATTVGGYALFGGGNSGSSNSYASSVVDAYNAGLTRSTLTSLTSARHELAAASVGGYAVFYGGIIKSGATTSGVDAYNSDLSKVTQNIVTGSSRAYLAATTVGNYALFGGGVGTSTTVFMVK